MGRSCPPRPARRACALGWVPEPIDLGIRRGQRFAVERGQTPEQRIDKRVEVVIVQRVVHPTIALSDIGIEIVGAEDDLEGARAADHARQPFQRSAGPDQSAADLGVAEYGALPGSKAHVSGQHELVADAARTVEIWAMLTTSLEDRRSTRSRQNICRKLDGVALPIELAARLLNIVG